MKKSKRLVVKKENGITMVALGVTIIILIILAGATLNLVLGDGGILGKAQLARNNYQMSANMEAGGLSNLSDQIDGYIDAAGGSNSGGEGNPGITMVGNAEPEEVLSGKKFYSNSTTLKTGTMPNNGAVTANVEPGGTYTIPKGYHNGEGKVMGSGSPAPDAGSPL